MQEKPGTVLPPSVHEDDLEAVSWSLFSRVLKSETFRKVRIRGAEFGACDRCLRLNTLITDEQKSIEHAERQRDHWRVIIENLKRELEEETSEEERKSTSSALRKTEAELQQEIRRYEFCKSELSSLQNTLCEHEHTAYILRRLYDEWVSHSRRAFAAVARRPASEMPSVVHLSVDFAKSFPLPMLASEPTEFVWKARHMERVLVVVNDGFAEGVRVEDGGACRSGDLVCPPSVCSFHYYCYSEFSGDSSGNEVISAIMHHLYEMYWKHTARERAATTTQMSLDDELPALLSMLATKEVKPIPLLVIQMDNTVSTVSGNEASVLILVHLRES